MFLELYKHIWCKCFLVFCFVFFFGQHIPKWAGGLMYVAQRLHIIVLWCLNCVAVFVVLSFGVVFSFSVVFFRFVYRLFDFCWIDMFFVYRIIMERPTVVGLSAFKPTPTRTHKNAKISNQKQFTEIWTFNIKNTHTHSIQTYTQTHSERAWWT